MSDILIVDDERIERNGIKHLLGHLSNDIAIHEASNGKEALEFLKEKTVDVLLTDVKMPFIDGIELIKQAAPLYPDMKIIIFSGYSEFEYAKFAMKMGVNDYILKPVDPEEFEKTLKKVFNEIEEARSRKDLIEESRSFMLQHYLYQLLNDTLDLENDEKAKARIEKDINGKYTRMLLLETEDEFFSRSAANVEQTLHDMLGESRYLNLNTQESVIFLSDDITDPKTLADKMVIAFDNQYSEKVYIALGDKFSGEASEFAKQLKSLEDLMEERFYHPSQSIFQAESADEEKVLVQIEDDTLMRHMKQDIKMKDTMSLRKHFDELCEKYREQTAFSQVYVKFIFSNLLKDFYSNLPNVSEMELNDEINNLYQANRFDTVLDIVNKNIERLDQEFGRNPLAVHREIESVKTYIYENYHRDLSVNELADHVFLAPSYLSYIFKKETGQNLSKFIKAYRMEKAREMLEETNKKIVNISAEVGYENVSYFCQSFREYFGVSPQKFRDQGEVNEKTDS